MSNQPLASGAAPPVNFKRKHQSDIFTARADLLGGAAQPRNRGRSTAQTNGLRYERRVTKYLQKFYDCYIQVPIYFSYSSFKTYKIYPDLLIFDKMKLDIVCCEIKRQHTSDGFHQLQFYRPVLERAFPANKISLLEVCATYPPRSVGVESKILKDLSELWNLSAFRHNVLVLSDYTLRLGLGSLRDGNGVDIGAPEAPLR